MASELTTEEAVNKPSVYVEEGVAIYRASSLASCQNRLLMDRLGYQGEPPPASMQARFNAGHDHEPLILAKLESHGTVVYDRQGTIELPIGSKAKVRGHIDGLCAGDVYVTSINGRKLEEGTIIHVPDLVIVDAKAFAVSTWEKWQSGYWKGFDYYAYQQLAYAIGYGAKGILMACKNKNTDDHSFDYWEVDAMPVTHADIIKKVMRIEALAERGESALFESPCSPVDYPCPFYQFHDQKNVVKLRDGEVVGGLDGLEALLDEAADLEADIKDHKQRIDEIKEQIVMLYGGKEATAKLSRGTITTYRSTSTVTKWDSIAADLKTDVETAKKVYTQQTMSEKISVRITPKKEK